MSFKKWIFIAIALFGVGMVVGTTESGGTAGAGLFTEDLAVLEELAALLEPFKFTTVIFILLKNILALLVSFVFSPLFCLFPVIALMVNGWLLSFISIIVAQEESVGFVIAAILPHGIIELPAFFMGEAAALSFGIAVMMSVISKERRSQLRTNLKQNIRYLVIACILLVPAAIIETYITPLFLQ